MAVAQLSRFHLASKRATDCVVAALALLVLMLPLVIVAGLIWLSSPGPILFRQERIGPRGRRFIMLKFRSMETGEANIPWAVLAVRGQIRYIKLGRRLFGLWLRRTHIDEWPQFINVLRGDMSLVGLRPALPSEEEILALRVQHGLDCSPVGITGLYQISGSKDLSITERLELERAQCRNWSYWRDWWIMLRTIPAVATCRGAGG